MKRKIPFVISSTNGATKIVSVLCKTYFEWIKKEKNPDTIPLPIIARTIAPKAPHR